MSLSSCVIVRIIAQKVVVAQAREVEGHGSAQMLKCACVLISSLFVS